MAFYTKRQSLHILLKTEGLFLIMCVGFLIMLLFLLKPLTVGAFPVVNSVNQGWVTLANTDFPTPTVTIKSFGNNASFNCGEKVEIEAIGQNPLGVSRMSIYIDGKIVKTEKSPSIEYIWDTGKEDTGEHEIKVIADEIFSKKSGSQKINVEIYGSSPSIKITKPESSNAVFPPRQTIQLSAEAKGMNYVRFMVDTYGSGLFDNIGGKLYDNYTVDWNTKDLKEGTYLVRVEGYSKSDVTQAKDEIYITLNKDYAYMKAPEIYTRFLPEEIYEGDEFTTTVTVKKEPELLFLQFKNEDGTWLSEEECKKKYSFNMTQKTKAKDGRTTYVLKNKADFPGNSPDYKKTFRVCGIYEREEIKTDKENIIIVRPHTLMPKIIGVNINPCSGFQGTKFTFYVKVKGEPKSLFLQFDDGSGGWLDEEFSKQYFSFDLSSPNSKSGYSHTYMLQREIHTPGEAPNYARKFRVNADYGDGSIVKPGEYSVIVVPE